MDVHHSQVIFPSNLGELFTEWNRFPGAVPFAGGTSFLRVETGEIPALPKDILSLENIEELRRITRTERYLEIGAMVHLSEIISLGKIIPPALSASIQGIAGPQLRNLATIGGNICSWNKSGGGIDASAAMIALDARYELRSASQSRWVSALRFSALSTGRPAGEEGDKAVPPSRELLTRIRIPLEQWNYTVCRKLHPRDLDNEQGGILICTAKHEKNILTEIRVVFAGSCVLRDRNSELLFEGRKLPLERKDALHYRELWEHYLSGEDPESRQGGGEDEKSGETVQSGYGCSEKPGPVLRSKLLNIIEACILGLAD
jgi:CO/xanthine dehydrogenase FAD-binding subunit